MKTTIKCHHLTEGDQQKLASLEAGKSTILSSGEKVTCDDITSRPRRTPYVPCACEDFEGDRCRNRECCMAHLRADHRSVRFLTDAGLAMTRADSKL